MTLKSILAKLAKGLAISTEEKAFMDANSDFLNAKQKEAVEDAEVADEAADEDEEEDADAEDADADEDEDAEVDEKGIQAIIKREIGSAVATAMKDLGGDDQATTKNRKKSAVTKKKSVTADRVTRDFVKAIITGDTVALKAMTTATGDTAKAGYTIPEILETEIMRLVQEEYGISRREMRYMPFSGAGNKRTIVTGGALSVYWTDEGGKKTSTQAVLAPVTQELKKLAAIVPLTDELIEDSAVNLTNYVATLFAEAIAKEEDDQFLAGDGTVYTGVVNDTNTNAVTMASGETVADITVEKLRAMLTATPATARRRGKFFMSPSTYDVIAALKDGSGNYLFPEMHSGRVERLLGKDVVLSESLPAADTTTASAGIFFFGDLAQAAVYGDKNGMQISTSSEATIRNVSDDADVNLWEQDMTAVRVVRRVGFVMALPKALTRFTNGA